MSNTVTLLAKEQPATDQVETTSLLKKLYNREGTDEHERHPMPEAEATPANIDDINYLIKGLENENDIITSDMDKSGVNGYDRRLKELDKIINRHLEQRARLVQRHEDGPEMLVHNLARIAKLRTQLAVMTSKKQVARLLTLAKQLHDIEGQQAPEMLAANLAHLGGPVVEEEFYASLPDETDAVCPEHVDDDDDFRADVRKRQLADEEG